MASNQFDVEVANPLQALLIGQKAYTDASEARKQQGVTDARAQAVQAYQTGNAKGALATLLGVGDIQGANAIGTQIQNDWTRQHTEKTDARQAGRDSIADQHWQASFGLQKRAADRQDEDKFGVKDVTDPNTGGTSFVKYNMRTGEVSPTGTPTAPSSPANPFSDGGKFNGDQGKAAGFTDRMLQSEGILGQPGIQDQGSNIVQNNLSKIPMAGNYLVSQDRQKYEQAKRDFINAQLRRESGAAIAPSEFDSADKQYFPVPGDTAETAKQKSANRRAAVEAMGREGGPSYRPKAIYTGDGRVVPLPKIGEMKEGYRFKGGDPSDEKNWAKIP